MCRLLLLAILLVANATWAQAQEFGRPFSTMFYWQKPLDATEKRESASAFGFRIDRAPAVKSIVLSKPILDLRFNQRGFHSLAFRGTVLHQNQPTSGEPAPEVNWWLVGGVAVGAAIVIHQDNKKFKDEPAPARRTGSGGTI